MAESQFVDVSFRGLELGQRLELRDFGPRTAFLAVGAPLPVGTEVVVATYEGFSFPARVAHVDEQVEGGDPPGMRLEVGELPQPARAWWVGQVTREDPPPIAELRTPVAQVSVAGELNARSPSRASNAPPAVTPSVVADAAASGIPQAPLDAADSLESALAQAAHGHTGPRSAEEFYSVSRRSEGTPAPRTQAMSAVDLAEITSHADPASEQEFAERQREAAEAVAKKAAPEPAPADDGAGGRRGRRGGRRKRR
jgi:hypothetical protein